MKNFLLGCVTVVSIVLFIWCLSVEARMNNIVTNINEHVQQFQQHGHNE